MTIYEGSAYLGVVGPDKEFGVCRDSINAVYKRNGDEGPHFIRATKGYEARQAHLNKFMDTHHSWLLLMDHDMVFPIETLERLRTHDVPYVSGLYMRRQYQPIAPIWYQDNPRGLWPHHPFVEVPNPDELTKIGASGWGCILVHREVIEAVRGILKGEQEIIEDDMDVWPYDLARIMDALNGLKELVETKPKMRTLRPALEAHTAALCDEIRVLRGLNDVVGSDIRFPFYAKAAGYQLWGDAGVRCKHMLDYPLSPDDFEGLPPDAHRRIINEMKKRVRDGRRDWRKGVKQYEQ